MYGIVLTRPDIVFVVGGLSRYLVDLAKHYETEAKGILRYIG